MATRKNRGDFLSLAKAATKREKVDADGVDMDVYAVTLTRKEIRSLTEASLKPGAKQGDEDAYDDEKLTSLLVGASIRDGAGQRLIPEGLENEVEDFPNPLQLALQAAALRVNGMGPAPEGDSGNS